MTKKINLNEMLKKPSSRNLKSKSKATGLKRVDPKLPRLIIKEDEILIDKMFKIVFFTLSAVVISIILTVLLHH